MKAGRSILAAAGLLVFGCVSASAQQITGVPGSPEATTTITGKQLPPPDPKFGGVIKEKASESKAWWAPRVVPPKGAPNVLLIMTDDQGFGAPSTFGGVIPTPTMDRIARNGMRYTNFHSTSLCSPTRAALITGRNHHSVGFGVVGEISTGFPGYDSIIPIEKGTIDTILKANGYAFPHFAAPWAWHDAQALLVGEDGLAQLVPTRHRTSAWRYPASEPHGGTQRLRLGVEEVLHLLELVRHPGGQIVELGGVLLDVVKLPLVSGDHIRRRLATEFPWESCRRRGRYPPVVIDGSVAKHLEVLRGVSRGCVGVRLVPRVTHANAF
ncbi:MAG: sulfatase-like hydrolase/transferase, partial [Pseudolabrys sp.]